MSDEIGDGVSSFDCKTFFSFVIFAAVSINTAISCISNLAGQFSGQKVSFV